MKKKIGYWIKKFKVIKFTSIDNNSQKFLIQSAIIQQKISSWINNDNLEKVSIGENCNSAWYLKETNNKNSSYPYDWIFSSPEIIIDTLNDNFEKFLDKKLITSLGKNAGHEYYHSSLFNHRNPLLSDNDYHYYKRSTQRLIDLFNNKTPVVFICTVLNEYEKRTSWYNGFNKKIKRPKKQTLADFMVLIDLILSKNSEAKFFFIEQYTEKEIEMSVEHSTKNIFWIKYCSLGRNNGVKYKNSLDDTIMKIIYSGLN